MKLRNIISIVTAGLFMMSSCTDEELIDSSTPDSGLSISLTTKGVMTKAAADGYTHSTPDEIKINTCVIAFFDVNTNEPINQWSWQEPPDDNAFTSYGSLDEFVANNSQKMFRIVDLLNEIRLTSCKEDMGYAFYPLSTPNLK